MTRHFLDFERPVAELESKIEELRHLSTNGELNIADGVGRLESTANRLLRQTYSRLTPWQKVQVARHPERPHCLDYIGGLITEFVPLAGDRAFADDTAIVGGIGRFHERSVLVIGTEKGADTESRIKRNFGMARPEGYRKARRLMRLAERFVVLDHGRILAVGPPSDIINNGSVIEAYLGQKWAAIRAHG